MEDLPKDLEKRHQDKENGHCRADNEKEPTGSEPERADVARSPQLKKLREDFKGHRRSGIREKDLSVLLQKEKGQQQK